MKKINARKLIIAFGATLALTIVILAIQAASDRAPEATPITTSPLSLKAKEMPSDRLIQRAELAIRQSPSAPDGYNLLCAAYIEKARETGDFSLNSKAQSALDRSLEISPNNFDALKLRTALLLTFHHFSEALEAALHAREINPTDPAVYGALTDAYVELGRYDEARKAADKMIALRPDPASYCRISYLRSLHGDISGATEAMRAAVRSASPRDTETIAWTRVHLGEELINAGKIDEAVRELEIALSIIPDYPSALSAMGRAHLRKNDIKGAIEFYRRAQNRVPLPDTAIALGDLYYKTNLVEEAKNQYELAEFIEHSGTEAAETYSRHIALLWANQDRNLDKALAIARRESVERKDIYTFDALAWCLFKKGEIAEARSAIKQAMRLGTRDAQIYYHAGMIYNASGDRREAINFLKLALETNPTFDAIQADVARRTLTEISG